jgi:hypothetical protein
VRLLMEGKSCRLALDLVDLNSGLYSDKSLAE